MKAVGFIGLGNMGGNMAHRLLDAGYTLHVNDINKAAAKAQLEKGAIWADTPKAMAQQCEVVLTSLPGPRDVDEVVLGKNGLSSGWKKGDIYIDTSTNSPTTMRKIYAEAKKMGVEVLDAPVSGGMQGVINGTLTIMVGGDAPTLEKSRSILLSIGKNIFHMGGSGCGSVAKLTHNIMSICCTTINAEAFVLGVKAGMDPATLLDILMVSTGYNKPLEMFPKSVFLGEFDPRFKLSLASKDIRLALELAKELDVPMPVVGGACAQQLFKAEASGLADKDHVSVIFQSEEAAGVKVRTAKK